VADSLLRIHDGLAEFKEGGYEDNQAWVDLDVGVEPEPEEEPEEAPRKPAARPAPAPPAPARAIDRDQQKTVKRWERKVRDAEAQVAELERKLAAIGSELAAMDPGDWQAFSARLDAQKDLETDLAYAMTEWEEAQTALEESQR
jgi:ATP-binding cassette subfamily F protein 3